jgi:Delta7-sterol 5-desaturase
VLNLAFFALTATIAYGLYRMGWTKIYVDLWERPWWYFAGSVLLIIAIHDTYFYWAHRLLHWKPLFRRVHRLHHLSLTPTCWAGYATHWGEGLLMSANFLIYPLLFPVHPLAILVYVVIQNIYSTLGHCGYDPFPEWLRHRWYMAWHNTPTHHDNHHRYTNGNYGHFFNLWDRLMGTEQPDHPVSNKVFRLTASTEIEQMASPQTLSGLVPSHQLFDQAQDQAGKGEPPDDLSLQADRRSF